MIVALDVDGTITAHPKFFACLSRAVRHAGGQVHIVTTRTDAPHVRRATERELRNIGVEWDSLYLLPDTEIAGRLCPHRELDWWNKYLWLKIGRCLELGVDVAFEDDAKVLALFTRYAPSIAAWRV